MTGTPNPTLRAAIWMLGTVASFILMMIAARELSARMSAFEILFFRSGIAFLIMLPIVIRLGRRAWHTERPYYHLARNSLHFAAQWGWVFGVAVLPLAEVTSLEFTMPIWTALLAMLFLGERVTSGRIIAVAGGFLGVLVILRPGIEIISPAAFVVLASAFCYACSNVMVKSLTRTDHIVAIVFFMQVLQMPMALIPALFQWVDPLWSDMPWLIAMGITALSAHYCMTRALQLADASVVLPIDFLRLPFMALVGFLFYTEGLDIWVLVGASVIFGANWINVRRETRAMQGQKP